jgi:sec-independent protein translocase protein TatB
MFDLGWAEMAVIMLVALIVIGPKDLPKVARTIGQWTGKARALARDFQRSLDDMAREAELDEIKKSIDKVGSLNIKSAVKNVVDPDDELERAFDVENKGGAKPGVKKPSNVRKPAAATTKPAVTKPAATDAGSTNSGSGNSAGSTRPALPEPTEPTIQPPLPGAEEVAKAPAAIGADQGGPSRG